MGKTLDTEKLGSVFGTRPDILQNIQKAADSPGRIALFNEIATHVYDQLLNGGSEPAHKKRRVDVQQSNGAVNGTKPPVKTETNAADESVLLEIKEISVSVPQRKKFELCFTDGHIYARAPNTTAPIPAITYAWSDIEHAFYLPVPEKNQVQHNYVLFPRGTCLPSKTNPPTVEPLVFTVPATAPKQGTIGGPDAGSAAAVSDNYKSLFHWALTRHLKPNGIDITSADPNKFHSMVRQPHRPSERAVHVKAFRGSKDGYLFFLETGILWGFKKPLMFIPLNRIAATSYTNILQRTFNVAIEVLVGEGDETEEAEFSMIDQEDYGGIDDYIKTHRLQDRSMAEQRKAKLELAENRAKKNGEEAEGAAAGGGDISELAKAQLDAEQALQDEEDEDEEDYDPGSDGDTDGSGESDDDDSDDDDDDDDEDEEDAEGEDEDEEDEDQAEDEEEEEPAEVKKEVKKEPKKEVKKEAKVVKTEVKKEVKQEAPSPPPKPVQQPTVKSGWAALRSVPRAPAPESMDLDEEKFDVV
ncbi:related to RTT106 regulator of Ty1 transposition [Fusarium torulosum]|uniref:Related to RTT106 regulator of Ty1 transposition n=1 Tax=Fusarium torulosum TaxID=33205 RepID=A0AAE8SEJ5_9HYPO|nr:related to RTT106 regulator of Ty1 transposition [Fusarium torulosum]